MRFRTVIVLALVAACSGEPSGIEAEVCVIAQAAARHRRQVEDTRSRVAALSAEWDEVTRTYLRAVDAFNDATEGFANASASRRAQQRSLNDATERLNDATKRWQIVQHLIMAAAVLDASHMDARFGHFSGSLSCEGGMSTGAFRAMLVAMGVSLFGLQVDHIVPRALGGADHPANYQLLPARVNQSLGAHWGADKCAMAGRAACARAVEVSRACGSFRGRMPIL